MENKNISIIHMYLPTRAELEEKKKQMREGQWTGSLHGGMIAWVYAMFAGTLKEFMTHRSKEVVQPMNQDWDLVIFDGLFSLHAYGHALLLKEHRNVPYVVFGTSWLLSSDAARLALGQNWMSKCVLFTPVPDDSTDKYDPTSFQDRFINFLEYADPLISPAMELMGVYGFSFDKLFQDAAFTVFDGPDRLGWPNSVVPDTRPDGSNCEPVGQLSQEYLEFLEDPKSKGTIYIAFGTSVDWEGAPKHIRETFLSAINEFTDYRIVFSYKGPKPGGLGKHIKITSWAPQLEILAHPRTKVFLTHSGLKSLREALCTKTPVVLMPMFAEQSHNAKFSLYLGIGRILNKLKLTKETIVASLKEVLENDKYAKRVSKLYEIMLDRPIPALDDAAFYVTRQIKHKGRPMFFKRKGMYQTLLEYHSLDILICIIAFLYFVSKHGLPSMDNTNTKKFNLALHNQINDETGKIARSEHAENGHQVTVFQTTSENKTIDMENKNISIIHMDLPFGAEHEEQKKQLIDMLWTDTHHGVYFAFVYALFARTVKEFMTHRSEEIVQPMNQDWDLVIFDGLFDLHTYGYALLMKEQRNVPYVIFGTTWLVSSDAARLALGQNWMSKCNLFTPVPNDSTDIYDPSSFQDRLINFLEYAGENIAMKFTDPWVISPAMEHMGVFGFSFDKLFQDAAFTVFDGPDRLGWPNSIVPDTRSDGSNCESVGKLSKEYLDFLEDPKSKGTIYIAFGTFVDWELSPKHIREAFLAAVNELTDYRIVFSYKGPKPDGLGKHIKITSWAPQLEILAHPRTKVFLTHSGLKSLREALCTKTPVVLENDKYAKRVSKLYEIMLDRPIPALDDAAFYVSRQIKHKDRPMFFKRKGMYQTLLEYHSLDILICIIAFLYFVSK
ncbi:UDP-glucoronosyl and UDP-glucosyl transferase domain-containing protein [Ditylenchus destructor]|nr:UDP-glucoronosyl and UDP-glucosyl transferase domain-containing protein [Ditylenchus destructor]